MAGILSLKEFSDALERKPPVDVITFSQDKNYLGERLYPRDTLILKLFYGVPLNIIERQDVENLISEGKLPTDILQRGPFNELVLAIGRRGGKTFLASIIACYEVYKLLLIDNPQAYYGIAEKDPIYVVNCAVSGMQAKTPMFEAISNKILDCPWFEGKILRHSDVEIKFQTESDKRKEKEIEILYGIPKEVSTVRVTALHTKSSSTRGKNAIVVIFDELAHFDETAGTGSADKMYEALKPSTKTFGSDGKVINISSPLTQGGKFYELYLRAHGKTPKGESLTLEVTKEMCVVQMPTWYINPLIMKESLRAEEESNPENFMMEYGAEFGLTIDRFLDPAMVDLMFIEEYDEVLKGEHKLRYEIHCDPAKNDAGMAVAIGHRLSDVAYIDHMKIFRVEEFPLDEEGKRIIHYGTVEEYIFNLCLKFNVKTVSFDQWNSIGSIQRIREKLREKSVLTRVVEETFTEGSNFDRYDMLKRCINRGFVKTYVPKSYPDGKSNFAGNLMLELKSLQSKDGKKVIKQKTGPCTTKDLADCVAVVVDRLMSEPHDNQKTRPVMPRSRIASARV